MKLTLSKAIFAAVLAVMGAGCGAGAIPDTTLAGQVNGKAFTALGALASSGFGTSAGSRDILIADVALTCADVSKPLDRSIIFSADWTAGKAKNLGLFEQTITFTYGGSNNNIATDGRLEIVAAPTDPNSTGKLKLRALAGADTVEGSIDVTVCPAEI